MTDLAYCYTNMTEEITNVAADRPAEIMMCDVELFDEEPEIPSHMIPPEDETDALPCYVHPSYPYGNPTNLKHPAAFPYAIGHPTSRALYEDIVHSSATAPGNAALRWQELALDQLLPVNESGRDGKMAALARETAKANAPGHNPPAVESSDESEEAQSQVLEDDDAESAQQNMQDSNA